MLRGDAECSGQQDTIRGPAVREVKPGALDSSLADMLSGADILPGKHPLCTELTLTGLDDYVVIALVMYLY